MRMCVACKEMKPKRELIRIVKDKEGNISLDFTGKANGRGAYICNDIKCIEKCVKSKALSRAFESAVSDEVYGKILEEYAKKKG